MSITTCLRPDELLLAGAKVEEPGKSEASRRAPLLPHARHEVSEIASCYLHEA